MRRIHAVYENGVFRPTEPVDLPDRTEVEFAPEPVGGDRNASGNGARLDAVYEVLRRRHVTGQVDLAQRHDEHQP